MKLRSPMSTSIPTDIFLPEPSPPVPCELDSKGWFRILTLLNSSKAVVGSVRFNRPNRGWIPVLMVELVLFGAELIKLPLVSGTWYAMTV
jgi:hypothetical protein